MISCLVSLWMAAAAGQAPPEAGWLKSVPSDVAIVARLRAPGSVRDDLVAMLNAMSPALAATAEGGIQQGMEAIVGAFGEAAGRGPFFVLVRLPDPDRGAPPAWGVIVETDNFGAAFKGVAQDGAGEPRFLGGLVSFVAKGGRTMYATRRDDWVAFGTDAELIAAIRKPKASLDRSLSPELKAKFLAGDIAIYMNIAAAQEQSGQAIGQFGAAMTAQIEQQADPANRARSLEGAKAVIAGLTSLLKIGDGLVLNLDFAASGLTFSGLATVKPGSPAARDLARAETRSSDLMARLPDDMPAYLALPDSAGSTVDPRNIAVPGGLPQPKSSPELERAVAARKKALGGRQVMGMSLTPMRSVGLADPKDPKAAVTASREAGKERQALREMPMTVDLDAVTHGGYQLDRIRTEVDAKQVERQLRAARPDVANLSNLVKLILPGDAITAYTGTDGELFFTTIASSEDQVKAGIDAVKGGKGSLGGLASWKPLRDKLPKQATALVVLNAREVVKTGLALVGAMSNVAGLKPPADFPETPALMGFALVASPRGYDFQLVIPSDVVPVFEKGFAPLRGAP